MIRAFLGYVADPEGRALIESLLARYEAVAAPLLPRLRKSMIHGDITSYNTLVEQRAPGQSAVSGLVDFGDMARSYTIGELAVAVSETAFDGASDSLAGAAAMVGAFHQVAPLNDDELAVLFDMICMRRCVVVVSIAQQLSLDPHNQYLHELSLQDWPVLRRLQSIDPRLAHAVFRHACGLAPHPAGPAIREWLAQNRGSFRPVVALDRPLTALDLGPYSAELHAGNWETPAGLRQAIDRRLRSADGIGYYDEARLIYSKTDSADEPYTLHLGADLFVPAGTPVCAPLGGVVQHVRADELILRHEPEAAIRFCTRYAGVRSLDLAPGTRIAAGQSIGAVAEPSSAELLPAHLHVQIGCELMGPDGTLPGLGHASQREAWLSLCPDPSPLLGIAARSSAGSSAGELVERRVQVVHQSQEYYYQRPMQS